MLRGIHKASTNWLGKSIMAVVLGLLVVSFVIWGIGDIFRGFGASAVAKVGSTEIGIEQFRQIYGDRLRMIGSQMQRPITQDQARAFGLDRQILSQLIAETALDERARQLRLGISNDAVADRIKTDTNFQGPDGKFDRSRFDLAIRNSGFNEPRYVAEQRRLMLRQQILETLSGGLTAPKVAVDIVDRYQNETRAIDYVLLATDQAGEIAAPSDEEIAKYFGERKALFRAPEYRKVYVLAVTPESLAKTTQVSDEEAAKFYDERRARYVTPESRDVHQMVFPTEEEAKAAYDRVQGGLSFADLAKERGLKPEDVDLGTVTKASIIDPAIADAAFSNKEGETSPPVKGRFGPALVSVGKIVPEQARDRAEALAEIKKDVGVERARGEISALRDKVEDARAGGETLEETAKKLNLDGHMIEAVDRSGRTPDGTQVSDLPGGVNVIPQAFTTQIGVENDAISIDGGGYVWYDVAGVTPSREREFDEVKDQVLARWKNDQVAERLKTKAAAIVEKVKAGATLEVAATGEGAKMSNVFGLKRDRPIPPITAQMLETIFATPKGEVATAAGESVEQLVFKVTDDAVPQIPEGSQEARQAQDGLQRGYSEDIVGQYVQRVQNDLGTKINPTAFNQVVGGAPSTDNAQN